MAVLDRYLGELQVTRAKVAEESLTTVSDPTAYGYGRAVGRLEGLRLAEETLNRVLNEQDEADSGTRRRSGKT